jgi:hypothetical protein
MFVISIIEATSCQMRLSQIWIDPQRISQWLRACAKAAFRAAALQFVWMMELTSSSATAAWAKVKFRSVKWCG